MNMEFSELRAFVVLAEELHFRKASERLGLSKPALSKKIQRLEEKLFVRSRRKVENSNPMLTPSEPTVHKRPTRVRL